MNAIKAFGHDNRAAARGRSALMRFNVVAAQKRIVRMHRDRPVLITN